VFHALFEEKDDGNFIVPK